VTISVALALIVGERGRTHLRVFLSAWLVAITTATVVILAALPRLAPGGSGPGSADSRLGPILGVILLVLSLGALWRGRSARSRPSVISHLDRASPAVIGSIGAVFALNPKNLALATAGVGAISGPVPVGLGALVVAGTFAAITAIPLVGAAGAAAVLPATTDTTLRRINTWLTVHGDTLAAVVLAVVGVWLLIR
jgi:hypothetical protein